MCSCNKKNKKYAVKLPGGMTVNKPTEAAAVAFATKHPGSKVIKPAA